MPFSRDASALPSQGAERGHAQGTSVPPVASPGPHSPPAGAGGRGGCARAAEGKQGGRGAGVRGLQAGTPSPPAAAPPPGSPGQCGRVAPQGPPVHPLCCRGGPRSPLSAHPQRPGILRRHRAPAADDTDAACASPSPRAPTSDWPLAVPHGQSAHTTGGRGWAAPRPAPAGGIGLLIGFLQPFPAFSRWSPHSESGYLRRNWNSCF